MTILGASGWAALHRRVAIYARRRIKAWRFRETRAKEASEMEVKMPRVRELKAAHPRDQAARRRAASALQPSVPRRLRP